MSDLTLFNVPWQFSMQSKSGPEAWELKNSKVLIVGSASTVVEHAEKIKSFSGDVWALNDSYFWLREQGVNVTALFVTDVRYLRKSFLQLREEYIDRLVTLSHVDFDFDALQVSNLSILQNAGRDGFSRDFGRAFHGCSVFFTALQCAVTLGAIEIRSCGVLFHPPSVYSRVDGSVVLPEYVHPVQLKNAFLAMNAVRQLPVDFEAFDAVSNLNYL